MIAGRLLLLFTVVVWGWTFVATKICLTVMTPVELLGLRLLIALPVLYVILRIRGIKLEFGQHRRQMILGAIILNAHFLIQITGLKYTSATNTGWIISVTPLVMAVLAYLVLKERITKFAVAGIVIATTGIFLLVSRGDLTDLSWLESIGDWLVLISAHTWALYTIATRDLSRARNPQAVTVAVLFPGLVVMLGIMAFTTDWSKFLHLSAEVWVALLFLGIAGMALAHWFWQEGIARVGAAEAGIFLYLEPLATTALAVPYLGEHFGVWVAVGGLMVLFGVWIAQRKPRGPQI